MSPQFSKMKSGVFPHTHQNSEIDPAGESVSFDGHKDHRMDSIGAGLASGHDDKRVMLKVNSIQQIGDLNIIDNSNASQYNEMISQSEMRNMVPLHMIDTSSKH